MSSVNASPYRKNGRAPRRESATSAVTRRERDDIYLTLAGRYVGGHLWALLSTLGQFIRNPLANLMTSMVIGVALAMPAGFYVMLDNARQLTGVWDDSTQITVFLADTISDAERAALQSTISQHHDVSGVTYVSREQALAEFGADSGLAEAIAMLDENPLPPVLIVTPAMAHLTPQVAQSLITYLKSLPSVVDVQMDIQWVKRLSALLDIGQRGIYLLGFFLGIAILVIVGNTIRLIIQNKRHEIVVTKLIGGTNAFIRRPFLYWGIWFGLAGGIVAWCLVMTTIWYLKTPVGDLASLYSTHYELKYLGAIPGSAVILVGILLGLVGAWLSVGRHLRSIEPR